MSGFQYWKSNGTSLLINSDVRNLNYISKTTGTLSSQTVSTQSGTLVSVAYKYAPTSGTLYPSALGTQIPIVACRYSTQSATATQNICFTRGFAYKVGSTYYNTIDSFLIEGYNTEYFYIFGAATAPVDTYLFGYTASTTPTSSGIGAGLELYNGAGQTTFSSKNQYPLFVGEYDITRTLGSYSDSLTSTLVGTIPNFSSSRKYAFTQFPRHVCWAAQTVTMYSEAHYHDSSGNVYCTGMPISRFSGSGYTHSITVRSRSILWDVTNLN